MEEDHAGRWPPDIESYFVDRCVEGTNLHKRRGRGWGKDGYEWLVNKMQKIGFRTSVKTVKQKWEHMKKVFRTWEALTTKFTGLGVHPETGHVDAPDCFWEAACKDDARMKRFKSKGIDTGLYAKYHLLFAGLSATGLNAWAPTPFAVLSNQDTQPAYKPSPPREGSGDSEDSQFGLEDFNSPEPSTRHISPTAGTSGSGQKRSRGEEVTSPKKVGRTARPEGSRFSRRSVNTMLSNSIDDMTTRLCTAVSSRPTTAKEVEKEKEYVEYHKIMEDVKQIPGWNERSMFHFFVLDLMHDDNKKKSYWTLSDESAKLLWLQHEWTKAFGQGPPP